MVGESCCILLKTISLGLPRIPLPTRLGVSNRWYVNYDYINTHKSSDISVALVSGNETEMDERWRFVGSKSRQYWLWWAIDHNSGEPWAFHFGTWEHTNVDERLALLKPFDINTVYAAELKKQGIPVFTPVKLEKGQSYLSSADQVFSELVSKTRQAIASFFNWLNEKTHIQSASKVRSTNGLIAFIFARIAVAALYPWFALLIDHCKEDFIQKPLL